MKKQALTARCLFVCSALLLLFANGAYGGRYQRTKDGQTLVWNNLRGLGDEATWLGDRDANGYAIGEGTLTWYRAERKIVTGSNIPSGKGRSVVVSSYSGKMVRGKFDGVVVNVDANGKTFHGTFVDGSKVSDWSPGPAPTPTPDEHRNERVRASSVVAAPAQEPTPAPDQRPNERVYGGTPAGPPAGGTAPGPNQRRDERAHGAAVREAPSQGADALQLVRPPSSLRIPAVAEPSPRASVASTPSSPSSSPVRSPSRSEPPQP